MKKKFTSDLSTSGLNNLINELEAYKDELPTRIAKAIELLSSKGINYAEEVSRTSQFGKNLVFRATVPEIAGSNITAIMEGVDYEYDVYWYQADGTTRSATVSCLLMIEFGSGVYAIEGHRGTFPTGLGHGNDPKGWYYKDEEGWHHSLGYSPKQPMLKAYNNMREEIRSAFSEAFGN